MHGYDLARTARRPWRIDPAHAVLVMDHFFLPPLGTDTGQLVNPDTAAGVHATFDVRIRAGSRFHLHFVFHDRALRVHTPSTRRVDCHLPAAPVAFLLVFWKPEKPVAGHRPGQLRNHSRH